MNINDLTIEQAKELATLFATAANAPATTQSPHIGKKCVIRTYASGVHFGELVAKNGREIELKNARRLWAWDVKSHGISLSEVANHGPTDDRTRICETVAEITILDGLEIIPATPAAIEVIESAPVALPE